MPGYGRIAGLRLVCTGWSEETASLLGCVSTSCPERTGWGGGEDEEQEEGEGW